jgi:hypothetical protein
MKTPDKYFARYSTLEQQMRYLQYSQINHKIAVQIFKKLRFYICCNLHQKYSRKVRSARWGTLIVSVQATKRPRLQGLAHGFWSHHSETGGR